jgi:hypothetical protein
MVLAAVFMLPYLPGGMAKNGELYGFIGGVVEARDALAEGQFPVRVAPTHSDGRRIPLFQFYGNLPYTFPALLNATIEKNPYAAWKMAMFATLVFGGWAMHGLVWAWTRRRMAAVAAVVVFLSAPYLFTNLHDRGAMSELTAVCLLPAALWATWRTLVRPGWINPMLSAAAWAGVAYSHNITYLYGATFAAAWVVSMLPGGVRSPRRLVRRVGRLMVAAAVHGAMVAWYLAPQVALMDRIHIGNLTFTPWFFHELTPLHVLLWPTLRTPEISTIPRLGLQVGWLVMASVLLATVMVALGRGAIKAPAVRSTNAGGGRGRMPTPGRLSRGLIVRLTLLWLVAFVVAWQPIDFWDQVPKKFHFVQFSYRLLGFTSLFGAILAGLAVSRLRPGRARLAVFAMGLAGAALTCWAYLPTMGPDDYHARGNWRWIVAKPDVGAGADAYLLVPGPQAARPAHATERITAEQVAERRRPDGRARFEVNVKGPSPAWVTLPVLEYPGMLTVQVDETPVAYGADGPLVVLEVPPGQHTVRVWFTGLRWANTASIVGWGVCLVMLGAGAVRRLRQVH